MRTDFCAQKSIEVIALPCWSSGFLLFVLRGPYSSFFIYPSLYTLEDFAEFFPEVTYGTEIPYGQRLPVCFTF
jgi:hypothetical protein